VPRIAVPDDIVPVVLMLASDEARYVTGAVVPVDGGMLAGHPAL
jgi:3-oxoacyl-[acyl-carrier protein] reductase